MLNIIKSNSISGLEKQLADKQTKLVQLRNQFSEVRQRADELGDQVAAALVDDASNLSSLEGQLHAAESRLRSTQAAIAKVEGEVADLDQRLVAEKDRVAREASAATYRQLAKDLEKAAPAATEATLKVAQIVGSLPANTPLPADQILKFWVPGAYGFFSGDVIGLTVQALRGHADQILAGDRPADLGPSIDQQSETYGRPKMAKAS